MAIITISRGSMSFGREVALKTAEMLGYEHVSREILLEASHYFSVPEMKLVKSIHDAPNILERITHGRDKYISYITAALLEHVKTGRVVYFGHAGHLLLPNLPNILKVRLIADFDARVAHLQELNGVTREQAIAEIEKDDAQRARWTRYLYKADLMDPGLYDIILKIDKMTVEDASGAICAVARSETFRDTAECVRELTDLSMKTHIQAALADICQAEVATRNGIVYIQTSIQKIRTQSFGDRKLQDRFMEHQKAELAREITRKVHAVEGVQEVVCDIDDAGYA